MVPLIFGILLVIVGIVFSIVSAKNDINGGVAASIIALVVGIVFCVASCIASVPTGYTGIVTTFGRVEDTTLEAGFHTKAPWQSVITMDNREQKHNYNFECFSKDIQETALDISVNFNINKATAMTLYKDVGTDYPTVLVAPRVYEVTKNVFSKYAAEELISQRDVLSDTICNNLQAELKPYGINVIAVSIEDIDFTDAFTNAVEAKQVATQEKLRAQTQQEQKTMETQQAAERQKIEAAAEAEVKRIAAEAEAYVITTKAEAEAAANKMVNESVTNALIDYVYATNWNGELPTTMLTPDSNVVVPLP